MSADLSIDSNFILKRGQDISRMHPKELLQLREITQNEIQTKVSLTDQLTKVRQRFNMSKEAVREAYRDDNAGSTILVPLSDSIYCSGRMEAGPVIVDIGTGYYVTKTKDMAVDYFDRRIKELDAEIDKLTHFVAVYRENLEMIITMLRRRTMELQAAQTAQDKGSQAVTV